MSDKKLILIYFSFCIIIASCDSTQNPPPLDVGLSGNTSVKPVISEPIEISVPNDVSVRNVIPDPIEVSVSDEIVVKPVISEPIEISVPNGVSVRNVIPDPIEVSVLDEIIVKPVISEPIEVSVPNDISVKAVIPQPMELSVPDEIVVKPVLSKPIEVSIPNDISVKTVISEPIEVSVNLVETIQNNPQQVELTTEKSNKIHEAMLTEADRLLESGDTENALETVLSVIKQSNDQRVLGEAYEFLKRIHPSKWKVAFVVICKLVLKVFLWLLVLVTIIILFLAIFPHMYSFMVFIFRWSSTLLKGKWRIDCIKDKTESGINELVISSLQQINSQRHLKSYTAGLIRLEASILNPLIPLSVDKTLNILPATEALPAIAGINLKAIASLFFITLKWLKMYQPSISGIAFMQGEDELVIRLSSQDSNGTIKVVSAAADLKDNNDMAHVLAEEASYKMLYMILHNSLELESERAYSLRCGIKCLEEYTSCFEKKKLEEAYKIFSAIQEPNFLYYEAQYFNAIVLDILEKHDEAIELFRFVTQHCKDEVLSKKAKYNQAIAYFRKYTPQALDEAINLLDNLIAVEGVVPLTPFDSLVLAAKANAIAHKFIFWRKIPEPLPDTKDPDEIKHQKQSRISEVISWQKDVEKLVDRIWENKIYRAEWTDLEKRQVEWAATNAIGNMYLNLSKMFIGSSDLDENGFTQNDKKKYLPEALSKFKDCEKLLRPGVETLTNLGTTLIELGRHNQAREYFEKAIKLNSHYEYAYYRTAQSWESEDNTQEVLRVINDFPDEPHIPGFIKLINKYRDSS